MSPQQLKANTDPVAGSAPAQVAFLRSDAENALAAMFDARRNMFIGSSEVARRREESFSSFSLLGIPGRRVEAWHYTDLRAALRTPAPVAEFPDAAARKAARARLQSLQGADVTPVTRLVILDGIYDAELSSLHIPDGLTVNPTCTALIAEDPRALSAFEASALGGEDAIVKLNEAFSVSGVLLGGAWRSHRPEDRDCSRLVGS